MTSSTEYLNELSQRASNAACPVCGAEGRGFFTLPEAPVLCHVRFSTACDAKAAPTGKISLAWCEECGMIYNQAFEPEKITYEAAYDNALHFSPHFRSYAETLANTLCQRHELTGAHVVEIGCGDGFFLNLLCEQGGNRGWGFDPTAYPRAETSQHVNLIQGYFTAAALPVAPELICCRHVLEHLRQPRKLLREIRQACAHQETVVFFEVPDARYTFERGGLWDILYEHCSYFTPDSLGRLFEEEGFKVLRIESAYHEQFLQIEATPGKSTQARTDCSHRSDEFDRLLHFEREFQETVRQWGKALRDFAGRGKRVVLWGAGTKGVMFLNAVGAGDHVAYVVDINPGKQGWFVAGTNLQIVSPEKLLDDPPGVVILMNPAYHAEVAAQLGSLGLAPRILSVEHGFRSIRNTN